MPGHYNRPFSIPADPHDGGLSLGHLFLYKQPTKQVDITYKGLPLVDRNKLQNYIDEYSATKLNKKEIAELIKDGKIIYTGKVGIDITEEKAILAAELCCLNILANLKKSIAGDWDKFDNFVKLGGFVNSTSEYKNHPKIINGASDLLVRIFAEQGRHTRFAVGSNSLPLGIAVEVDAIIQLK